MEMAIVIIKKLFKYDFLSRVKITSEKKRRIYDWRARRALSYLKFNQKIQVRYSYLEDSF